ncbi:MAG: DUF2949 domain-containing protein [Oscillatoriales cyanobacterium RM2_1_1]|nr:DUF2949 domain-containing protein [Oscillatoriales cyanobacterium RM2_1_1]
MKAKVKVVTAKQAQLIQFLRWELAIPASSISMALNHSDCDSEQLPMILWQYGLVSLDQLDQIFDWLEQFGGILERDLRLKQIRSSQS